MYNPDDEDLGPPSIYDGDDPDQQNLWFLPPGPEDDVDPESKKSFIFYHNDWREAERNLSGSLADATYMSGCLDERIRLNPAMHDRIARIEAVELAWLAGYRLGHDALHKHLVLADYQHERDQEAVVETRWAHSRYMSPLHPLNDDIRDVLGRHAVEEGTDEELIRQTGGRTFDDLYEEWKEYIEDAEGLHRFTLGALAFFSWQSIQVSGDSDFMEAAVVSQKLCAPRGRRGGLGFVPLALGGHGAFMRAGTIEQRLATWYRLVENACHRALLNLNAVELFKQKSEEVEFKQTATYQCISKAFVDYPILNIETLLKTSGTGKDAALKYIDLLEEAGLIAEITGQKRYRFWRISSTF
ncbi:hypothetical protein FIU85_22005 (plasmid) [Roseovarius sp. THAF8]|uniref:hypothetical protein n=1 Tax=Roseovarius sp. THAF8 TaxID=2587846 RepID=UPI001267A726|nr:hypothetical protein [Roseovarius sp. THAF8]QFU00012.1 hypothetical protein FIU85_22005 [Roseovarius sp. THAF8]